MGLTVSSLTGLFVWSQQTEFRRQLQLRANALADLIQSQAEFALLVADRQELQRIASRALASEDVVRVTMSDVSGTLLAQAENPGSSARQSALGATGPQRIPTREAPVFEVVRVVSANVADGLLGLHEDKPDNRPTGVIRVSFSMLKQRALSARAALQAVGVAALVLSVFTLFHYLQLRRLLHPLQVLIEFTRRVGQGDLSQKAPETRRDEIGQLTVAFNEMVDQIASRKQLAEHLGAAREANRLKSEFLANMSHEIRTPLNGVLGMTELALGTELTAEQRDYLKTAEESAEARLSVLNDILDFSKIEAGCLILDPVPFPLAEFLHNAMRAPQMTAARKGIRLDLSIAADVPPFVRCDPNRLRQVVLNLLNNALKFTSSGSVSLSVETESRSEINVILRFAVRDTGVGIALHKQSIIFEPFRQADSSTTRKYGGSGLGLAICARLVGLMGGRIWVESEPGRGSTFYFTASFERAETTATTSDLASLASAVAPPATAPLNILLAEDNLVNQKLAARLLEKAGHSVTVAADGREALAALERRSFDLLLLDVQMPELDGLETARIIRRREAPTGPRLPILALTAHALKGDREKCLAAGMDGYVAKPIRLNEISQAIQEVTSGSK